MAAQPAASRIPAGRTARALKLGALLADLASSKTRDRLQPARMPARTERADRIAATLAELRGAALKLGQLVSLQGGDLLPPELRSALSTLRDGASIAPFAQIEGVLRSELGSGWRDRFESIEPEPLAAASIGQVHAARARDGRELALKIQYPGVARSIDADVDMAALLLRATGLGSGGRVLGPLVERIKRELQREADYRREAESTSAYRGWVEGDPDFEVPRVHADLSTRRLLATDRLRGLPVDDLRSPEHSQALRDRLGTALLALAFRELLEFRAVQTDPNFANYLYLPRAQRIGLVDFGALLRLPATLVSAYRELLRALVSGSDRELAGRATGLGLLSGNEDPEARSRWLLFARAAAEPLRAPGPYDFAGSDLGRRVRGLAAAAYRTPALPVPSAEILLVQRKLAGTFLLLQHIGARVDAHAVYERFA